MHTTHSTPAVRASRGTPLHIDTDLLVVPVFEDDDLADLPGLDAATGGEPAAARARGAFRGKPFEQLLVGLRPAGANAVLLVGAGTRRDCTADRLRRVATIAGLAARQRRVTRIALAHRSGTPVALDEAASALTEGAVLANYEGASYKSAGDPTVFVTDVDLLIGESAALTAAVERGLVLGECTNIARALANEPGNALTPQIFAEHARAVATAAGLTVDVLDDTRIAELGMGLLLGVARGSQEPPRVVVLQYTPDTPAHDAVLGLVGKGVTFDTGGISIKPADNMDKMKDDMSGGAAVLAAMVAVARLRAPVRCIGVIPLTENMPGGRAIKPGDILTSAEGKTVEVLNTDAEGRLILGDGLWYARRLGATHLVDVATLTGSVVIALGKTTTGLFGRPDAWVDHVRRATERAGDRSWPMPIFDDYREQLDSEIADITNTGGRPGGSITGALFIKEFAGDLPWVHMDIAGTAWAEESKPYQPKGATGVAVRTLAHLALSAAEWKSVDSTR